MSRSHMLITLSLLYQAVDDFSEQQISQLLTEILELLYAGKRKLTFKHPWTLMQLDPS